MKEPLDPWIEGYLDYQLKVRRLRPRSVIDLRCTLKRAVTELGVLRPAICLWKLTLEDYLQWLNQQREAGYSTQSLNKELSHLRGRVRPFSNCQQLRVAQVHKLPCPNPALIQPRDRSRSPQ